ncbi:FN3 associated domain-containing protein [uncultured Dokdonia sp.]|uniref:FN3 associated domain-containing protein n=1 Tax=uncultured Dokdonia sp. TaxID=575653 RepID=UPI0026382EF2|nr:FN3 associated domain-containing protein [uncultured Dokdonia sp.]
MKESNQAYKSIFLIILTVFGVMTLYTLNTEEVPRFVLFFGRFHPLLLHLPIGALVVTFFIDMTSRFQKKYPTAIIRNLIGFTAVFAIITCFFGYFLSLEGGYQEETLDLHFYTGIATAVLTSGLFLISNTSNQKTKKLFLPLFIATLILISIAGHYGSVLTHGDNFLTEYARVPEKEKTIEVVDSLRIYDDVIAKILDDKCMQCHNASKQKGELSLLTKETILRGGVSGVNVIEGNAAQSLLYTRLLLPISDEEHMPPEGKAQLTKDEIWLLKHWIDQGLDFENYATHTMENDTLRKKLKKYLVFNEVIIPKAPTDAIEEVKAAGFRVLELVPGKGALTVKLLRSNPTKEHIETLSELEDQIVELDVNTSEITDEMTTVFKDFKNLKSLRLDNTKITDASIKNIKKLEHLEVLNMYNTAISNEGLSELVQTIQPKQIYAWQTQVDQETATKLAKQYNINIQSNSTEGFVESSQLEPPLITPTKTLFKDTIHITLDSRLKNVDVRYTLNGETPDTTSTIYTDKIILDQSKTLKVAAFKKGWEPSEVTVREYANIQQEITNFTIQTKPDKSYPDANKLFDLREGSLDFKDGNWTGYFGTDLNTTIDLGAIKPIQHVSFSTMESVGSWILYPTDFTVYTSTTKKGPFKKAAAMKVSREGEGGDTETKKVTLELSTTEARYVKVVIKNHDKLPEWHPAAGNPAWLFVDEIYFW